MRLGPSATPSSLRRSNSWSGDLRISTAIWPPVIVPVLSEQIAFTVPSVSTAASLRIEPSCVTSAANPE